MYRISATRMKARLGEALARAASEPVAIERHGRVIAYLVPPQRQARPGRRPAKARAARRSLSRAEEERLLSLCASGDLRPSRWARAGDPYLMAGIAALLASVGIYDRTRLFALAERLYPGMSSLEGYAAWLERAPVQPDRFLPMLRARLAARHA